jgi:hypothetical protein
VALVVEFNIDAVADVLLEIVGRLGLGRLNLKSN